MSELLKQSLGNEEWLKNNVVRLQGLFPETWTHVENISLLSIGFQLKVIGVDWRSEEELKNCMVLFEKSGVLERQGLLIRRGRL